MTWLVVSYVATYVTRRAKIAVKPRMQLTTAEHETSNEFIAGLTHQAHGVTRPFVNPALHFSSCLPPASVVDFAAWIALFSWFAVEYFIPRSTSHSNFPKFRTQKNKRRYGQCKAFIQGKNLPERFGFCYFCASRLTRTSNYHNTCVPTFDRSGANPEANS